VASGKRLRLDHPLLSAAACLMIVDGAKFWCFSCYLVLAGLRFPMLARHSIAHKW
jgi:hypothetical protein